MTALLLALLPLLAVDPGAANEAFWKGQFKAAAKAYREVAEAHPHSADAWYNLGTAEARVGRSGRAVHAFEQALLLRPGDPDATHNLEQVRDAALSAIGDAGGPRLFLPGDDDLGTGLLTALPPDTLAGAFAVAWALFFLLLGLWWRAPTSGRRTALSFGALLVGLFAFAGAALLGGRMHLVESVEQGVVLTDRATVHAGPGERSGAVAAAVGGVKVRLRGADGAWVHVTLPDGSEGWLAEADLGRLLRP